MEHLEIARERDIVTLTLRRESRRNALDGPLWTALGEAARSLAAAPPRVVIVTGAGGHFSAGMDLKPDNPLVSRLLPAVQSQDTDTFRALILELKASVDALTRIGCPVIAAVDGACMGGGLEVALACDLRVAGPTAQFSMPEARVGMMADVGGTVRLMRTVGRARALDLCATGRAIDAQTALAWGLVDRVAEGDALTAARALAADLLTAAPSAARELVTLLRADAPTFAEETEAGVRVLSSGEVMEGVMAFLERRPPKWSGR